MLAHTKKRLTKIGKKAHLESLSIKAESYLNKIYGEIPKPSIYLAGLRYRENITQKELGKILGIDQSNISKMEKGERQIGKKMAKKLALTFNVDYRMFL